MKSFIHLAAIAALLSGCANTPTAAPVEYLLRPSLEQSAGPFEQPPRVALGRVSIPPYLDREGIVVETGDSRVQAAAGHRWAQPLARSIRRVLQVEVARALNQPVAGSREDSRNAEVIVDVSIHQFHGSVDGEVLLAAEWQLREPRTSRVLARREFVRTALTDESGYDALVSAHEKLLTELSRAIADSLGPDGAADQITSR